MASKRVVIFLVLSIFLAACTRCMGKSPLLSIIDGQGSNASDIQTYIVDVLPPDSTKLLGVKELDDWYRSFLPNSTLDSGEPRLVYSYHHVISGFAARLTAGEVRAMEAMDGFLLAQPDQKHDLLTTHTPAFLGLNTYGGIWKDTQGEGAIIGVVDSGILPTHVSFRDDGMAQPPKKWRGCCEFNAASCNAFVPSICNNKLLGARSFFPSSSPMDEQGHGTHVASSAAGNFVPNAEVNGHAQGMASGMAPRAHLAAYKACGHSCWDSALLAGMEQAIKDGVDVLSLSFDSAVEPFHRSTIAKATFAAMEKGIVSSACAGNAREPVRKTVVNDAPWIMTVGASTTDRTVRAVVKLANGMEFYGQSAYPTTADDAFNPTMVPLFYPGGIVDADPQLACLQGSLDKFDVRGKIVLCGVGRSDPPKKGEVVKKAGGAGLIVLNQKWNGYTTESEAHVLPTAHVTNRDALKLVDYVRLDPDPKGTIIFEGTRYGHRPSPAVASLSAAGPSRINGGILKPDIIGPGINILAAWHKQVGSSNPSGSPDTAFNFASGCSMATPHLAGIAALIKSAHPDWSPAAIKSAIMTTAHVLDRDGIPIVDERSADLRPATYFEMGSGHVNPSRANNPGLVYDVQPEDYLGYLCGLRYSDGQVSSIARRRIRCSSVRQIASAEELNYPSISVSLESATEKTATRTVTNVGASDAVYLLQVHEPEGVSVVVSPERLQFSENKTKEIFTVKFNKRRSHPSKGKFSEGHLSWVSGKHVVRSPLSVRF